MALTLQQVQQSTILGSKSKVFCALDFDAMMMIFFPGMLRSALADFKYAITGLQSQKSKWDGLSKVLESKS